MVDTVLIPEVNFKLEGPNGLLAYIGKVLETKGHAVLCVAEGAGQVRFCWGGRGSVLGEGPCGVCMLPQFPKHTYSLCLA